MYAYFDFRGINGCMQRRPVSSSILIPWALFFYGRALPPGFFVLAFENPPNAKKSKTNLYDRRTKQNVEKKSVYKYETEKKYNFSGI